MRIRNRNIHFVFVFDNVRIRIRIRNKMWSSEFVSVRIRSESIPNWRSGELIQFVIIVIKEVLVWTTFALNSVDFLLWQENVCIFFYLISHEWCYGVWNFLIFPVISSLILNFFVQRGTLVILSLTRAPRTTSPTLNHDPYPHTTRSPSLSPPRPHKEPPPLNLPEPPPLNPLPSHARRPGLSRHCTVSSVHALASTDVVRILVSLVIQQEPSIEEIGYPPFIHLRLFWFYSIYNLVPVIFVIYKLVLFLLQKERGVSVLERNSDELCS
jgi:hypothetical protein